MERKQPPNFIIISEGKVIKFINTRFILKIRKRCFQRTQLGINANNIWALSSDEWLRFVNRRTLFKFKVIESKEKPAF